MKQVLRFFFLVAAILLVLSAPTFIPAALGDFDDVAGHWAETTLRQALVDGLIVGDNGYLRPDDPISTAQALTIICRILGAEAKADIRAAGLTGDEWYYDAVAKAAWLGILTPSGDMDYSAPMTRGDAFLALAEAFQLIDNETDATILAEFTDAWQITGISRQALAAMLTRGVIDSRERMLRVGDNTTRAEFLSAIYTVAGEFQPSAATRDDYDNGVVIQGSAELTGKSFASGVWFDCAATEISLDRVNADNVVIRSHILDSLTISGLSHIERLTLASQSGDVTISPTDDAVVDMLIIGDGGGRITTEGVGFIEIAGDGRHVTISGKVETVIVSGQNNTIQIQPDAVVGLLELRRDAIGSRVVIDGVVNDLVLKSEGSSITGRGSIDLLALSDMPSQLGVKYGELYDLVDRGLSGASLRIAMPSVLQIGDTLKIETILENAEPGKVCEFTWYVDNRLYRQSIITTGDIPPVITRDFEYTRLLQERLDVRVVVKYNTTHGEYHELTAEGTVKIENYDKAYWMNLDAPGVLEKVTLGYLGDFTLEWAEANDLDDYDKEVWVNAKGYSSTSKYLLWVNLAYQRVNIFEGSAGNWELIRTCIVGSGRPGNGTMTGVTTTTYKQLPGWTTATYTVRPVVRFRPDSGYAFHSRLYVPYTDRLSDPSIGFPVSSGCIRMYDEDIWFIYDNVPEGTTVVIY